MAQFQRLMSIAGTVTLGLLLAQDGRCQAGFGGLRIRSTGGGYTGYRVGSSFNGSGISNFMIDSRQFRSSANSANDLLSNRGSYSNSLRSNLGGLPRYGAQPLQLGGSSFSGGLSRIGMTAFPGSIGMGRLAPYSSLQGYDESGSSAPLIQIAEPARDMPKMDLCEEFRLQCQASGEEAGRPIMEKQLQRPQPGTTETSRAPEAETPAEGSGDGNYLSPSVGNTTRQGALFIAQQMSRAREFIRQSRYDQAINFYQAAQAIDARNVNAGIGVTYCHIMAGKLQAGGLGALNLVQQEPDFWMQPPEYGAVLGIGAEEVIRRFEDIRPGFDQFFQRYRPEDGKQVAEDLKLASLARMFMAWMCGDHSGVKNNIQAAAQVAPLDAPVQQLCHRITGTRQEEQLQLKPLKPLQ